jgi:pimeloyl-ACP methyl ester carboxylesterase
MAGVHTERQLIVRVGLGATILLLLAAGAGFAYNDLSLRHYRRLHPAPGKLYPVDGYNMHLYCQGTGAPTILLEAGQGGDWTTWGPVQPGLEKITRTCSYDRAGLGWSDSRPGARDSNAIAEQLHRLIIAAQVQGPLLLVARSAGGLHARAYLHRYPQDIVGLVLIDASTPEQVERFPARVRANWDAYRRQLFWDRWLATFGVTRLRGRCGVGGWGASAPWSPADDDCFPVGLATARREAGDFTASAAETLRTGPFPSIPVLIFSQDPSLRTPGVPEAEQAETADIWNLLQEGLKNLSPHSRRIIVRGSPHHIEQYRPELLVAEISHLVQQLRGTALEMPNWGSTTTQ